VETKGSNRALRTSGLFGGGALCSTGEELGLCGDESGLEPNSSARAPLMSGGICGGKVSRAAPVVGVVKDFAGEVRCVFEGEAPRVLRCSLGLEGGRCTGAEGEREGTRRLGSTTGDIGEFIGAESCFFMAAASAEELEGCPGATRRLFRSTVLMAGTVSSILTPLAADAEPPADEGGKTGVPVGGCWCRRRAPWETFVLGGAACPGLCARLVESTSAPFEGWLGLRTRFFLADFASVFRPISSPSETRACGKLIEGSVCPAAVALLGV
jgi:hypothetical protein